MFVFGFLSAALLIARAAALPQAAPCFSIFGFGTALCDSSPTATGDASATSSSTATAAEPTETVDLDLEGDVDYWCQNTDLRDRDALAHFWRYFVSGHLDSYIDEHGPDDWLVDMANETWPNSGNTGAYGCNQPNEPCLTRELDCTELVRLGFGERFWIFTAVQIMQREFAEALHRLVFSTLKDTLEVSTILSDVMAEQQRASTSEILGFIAAGATILTGAFAFAFPGTRMVAGAIGGGAATAAIATRETSAGTAQEDLELSLAAALSAIDAELRTYLMLAVGDRGADNNDYASLPDQGPHYRHPIPAFFHDGRFLQQGSPDTMIAETFKWVRKALFVQHLQSQGYAVIGENQITLSESQCTDDDNDPHAARYYGDIHGGTCFHLYAPGNTDMVLGDWRVIDQAFLDTIQNDYGIDIDDLYRGAYECTTGGDGTVDVANLPEDGVVPLCFYNLASYEGRPNTDNKAFHMVSQDWPKA